MSDSDEQAATRRLRGPAARRPDDSTMALGAAGGLVQSWAAVPLAGEDAPPPADPDTALLETVRAPDTGTAPASAAWPPPRTPAPPPGATRPAAWPQPRPDGGVPTRRLPAGPQDAPPDDGAWPTQRLPVTPQDAPPADGALLRFGPGVPAPEAARAAAVRRGETAAAARPRRRRGGPTLAVLVLLAVAALLLWRRSGPALAVDGVAVTTAARTVGCDGTARITATVRTHGGAGTLRYRWARNDGTADGPLTQEVAAGSRSVLLPLRWTFHGHGTYRATATLTVEAPGRHGAPVSFTYACPS